MKKIVSVGEKKSYMYLSKLGSIEVFKTPVQDDGCEYPPYVVKLNGSEDSFLTDGERLYLEFPSKEANLKELEEHAQLTRSMEEAGKTEIEIQEEMKGRGNSYVDRVEYIVDCPDFQETLRKAISTL